MATIIGILLNKLDWNWLMPIIESITFLFNQNILTRPVLADTINGFALGLALTFCLNIIQSRRSSSKVLLREIVLNALWGGLAGMIVFFIGVLILSKLYLPSFLAYIIVWIFLGAFIGVLNGAPLYYRQVVDFKYGSLLGLKGGLIGGCIAFPIAYLINTYLGQGDMLPYWGQMLSFMSYGGILGLILYTTLQPILNFELICLSPSHFSGWKSPISKWLRSGSQIDAIVIGKDPRCYVYIKWEDEGLMPRHAELKNTNEIVYIEPKEGDVLVNNKLIAGAHALNDEDIIRLGKDSISILQFRAVLHMNDNDSSSNTQGEQFFPVMTPILKRSEWRNRIDID